MKLLKPLISGKSSCYENIIFVMKVNVLKHAKLIMYLKVIVANNHVNKGDLFVF